MYWIYTSYSISELKGAIRSPQSGATDIALLATLHEGWSNVCQIETDGFQLVYNGIGGGKCGLRERIHQHFNGGEGTGALAILRSSVSELDRWRVSYVTYQLRDGSPPDLMCQQQNHRHLERMWRLQHGWPLLCRT